MNPLREHFDIESKFLVRRGPSYEAGGSPPCQKKLCFTSTRIDAMLEVLYELSLREDCFLVKLDPGQGPHGMVRGRCFLTTEDAVAEVWLAYKSTDHVLCTIQDDDFTRRYR